MYFKKDSDNYERKTDEDFIIDIDVFCSGFSGTSSVVYAYCFIRILKAFLQFCKNVFFVRFINCSDYAKIKFSMQERSVLFAGFT